VRQGCARRPPAVPEEDEREGANLEQPDSGGSRCGAQGMQGPGSKCDTSHHGPRGTGITICNLQAGNVRTTGWNGACEGQGMLSTEQKAVILRKAGIAVPPVPRRRSPQQEGDQEGEQEGDQAGEASASHRQLVAGSGDSADGGDEAGHAPARQGAAIDGWIKAVDKRYADYALARAAHSLREAELARTGGVR